MSTTDEVGDMDLDLQTKMLRVLQDGVLRRVGSKEFKRVDVRIISATNRDLLGIIKDGRFREDLYYRIRVFELNLPPLRERMGDLGPLLDHLLETFNELHEKEVEGLSEAARACRASSNPGSLQQAANAAGLAYSAMKMPSHAGTRPAPSQTVRTPS